MLCERAYYSVPLLGGMASREDEYFDANPKTIRRVLDELDKIGFSELIEERVGESTIRRAVAHKEWAAKHPGHCCAKKDRKNPSQSVGVPKHEPLPISGSTPSQPVGGDPSQLCPEPLPVAGSQVSELVSEEVSEKFPKGSSGREIVPLSVSAISLSQEKPKLKPGSQGRQWLFGIWKNKTGEPLNVRKTDLSRLERFISEHGERKTARAWFSWVNADPAPYNLFAVEIAVKRNGKNGEWLEGAEDNSQITRFPLASFLSAPDGYLAVADGSFGEGSYGGEQKFDKATGGYFSRCLESVAA